MIWDNRLPGMAYVGLVMRPPWEFRILVGLIVFFILRSAFKWIVRAGRASEPELSGLMKVLKKVLLLLSICTVAFFVATCAVGMAGGSTENGTLLAISLKLWYCIWFSLCVTCVVAFLLLLVWLVHVTSRWFPWPTYRCVATHSAEEKWKDDTREGKDRKERANQDRPGGTE